MNEGAEPLMQEAEPQQAENSENENQDLQEVQEEEVLLVRPDLPSKFDSVETKDLKSLRNLAVAVAETRELMAELQPAMQLFNALFKFGTTIQKILTEDEEKKRDLTDKEAKNDAEKQNIILHCNELDKQATLLEAEGKKMHPDFMELLDFEF
jgi:hypothetical protein